MATPSEILCKQKAKDSDDPKKSDDKKDKSGKRNALIDFIAKHKKGDVGKHNNGTTTGFKAVEKKAEKEYGSKEAGEKVAGAVYQHMKKK